MGGSSDHRLLRILHIDPEKNWGGGEAQVLGLLTHLAARGHHNDLLAHPGGRLFARCQNLNVRAYPLVMRNDLDVRCVWALRQLIQQTRYDIVHFHTKRAHTLAFWLPRGKQRPRYVVTRRMDYPETRSWYTSCLYNRRVDGVVAISQSISNLLVDAGVEKNKIRCIASGIESGKFENIRARTKAAENLVEIGCLAGLEERKGLGYLLESVALLKADGMKVRCQIAGDGPQRAHLEEEVQRLSLRGDVHFLGFITDTTEFFAGVDIFAMPSLFEGLGVAALEAMAAGKPVVATRVGGLTESVLDGVTGFLVPPRDSASLASAIAKLVRAPALAEAMGQQGRDRARQHFSLQNMARQNESYYHELLRTSS